MRREPQFFLVLVEGERPRLSGDFDVVIVGGHYIHSEAGFPGCPVLAGCTCEVENTGTAIARLFPDLAPEGLIVALSCLDPAASELVIANIGGKHHENVAIAEDYGADCMALIGDTSGVVDSWMVDAFVEEHDASNRWVPGVGEPVPLWGRPIPGWL